jgi:hypothetical protein
MHIIPNGICSIAITTAHAGSNTCEGNVMVGKEWTTAKGDTGDFAPDGCRFLTSSKLGRRIIAACPDGSQCLIDVPLNKRSHTITSITNVETTSSRQPSDRVVNEAVVRGSR